MQKYTIAVFLIITLCVSASASAQGQFEFVAHENLGIGEVVLANLELDETEFANHENVVNFFFSSDGDEIFRLGQDYAGTFDGMSKVGANFYLAVDGTLTGRFSPSQDVTATMFDGDPPLTSLPNVDEMIALSVSAGDASSRISMSYLDIDNQIVTVNAVGTWLLVPEPGQTTIAFLAVPCLLLCRTKRS